MTGAHGLDIAVLVPCLNEQEAIGAVVAGFRAVLPGARVIVYDNGSTDRTVELALAASAEVRREPRRGKGNVVRRMFADVEADVYVLVDGDGTYSAATAPLMIDRLLEEGLDLVTGVRAETGSGSYRPGHRFGNRLLTGLVARVFGRQCSDMLSGYRVMSRRFVKSFPALSAGFEVETELTVHALELRMPIGECPTSYGARAEGSNSKLRTYGDGLRILRTIANLVRDERPLEFFTAIFATLAVLSVALGWPVVLEFLATGLVLRFPTALLSLGLMLLAFLSLACGLILDTVTRGRRELRRLAYLQVPAVASRRAVRRPTVLAG